MTVGERAYTLWEGPALLQRVIGTDEDRDVPYTMWQLDGLDRAPTTLVRIKTQLAQKTYDTQVGTQGEFQAYGEALLLDKIWCQDLPHYHGDEAVQYW